MQRREKNILRDEKREAENLLTKLLEIDPYVFGQNEYMLYCKGLDYYILCICEKDAEMELQESWLSAGEHEVIQGHVGALEDDEDDWVGSDDGGGQEVDGEEELW